MRYQLNHIPSISTALQLVVKLKKTGPLFLQMVLAYQVPIADTTNDHECSGFKQHTFFSSYSSEGQKSGTRVPRLKARCGQDCTPFQKLGGRIYFLTFLRFCGHSCCLPCAPVPHLLSASPPLLRLSLRHRILSFPLLLCPYKAHPG